MEPVRRHYRAHLVIPLNVLRPFMCALVRVLSFMAQIILKLRWGKRALMESFEIRGDYGYLVSTLACMHLRIWVYLTLRLK